jgi:hypothetical protein
VTSKLGTVVPCFIKRVQLIREFYLLTPLKPLPDHVNNVERSELQNPQPGDNITFLVRGTSIVHRIASSADSQLPQRWALAVVGDFRGVLRTALNPVYARPQRLSVRRRAWEYRKGLSVFRQHGCFSVRAPQLNLWLSAAPYGKSTACFLMPFVMNAQRSWPADACVAGF